MMNYGSNGKMNTSKLLLSIVTCSAIFANTYAENCITVPELNNPKIKIDGKITEKEWQYGSVQFGSKKYYTNKLNVINNAMIFLFFRKF